jgi:hypothetical protein
LQILVKFTATSADPDVAASEIFEAVQEGLQAEPRQAKAG